MRLLIAGDGAGLARALAAHAAASGLPVRLADGRTEAEPLAGVEPLAGDPVTLLRDGEAAADVVVVVAERADGRHWAELGATLAARLEAGDPGWRRFVYWGSDRVYAPAAGLPLRPASEDAPRAEAGAWAEAARVDRALTGPGLLEGVVLRAAPVAGPGIDGWVRRLATLPVSVTPPAPVPLQLVHVGDAVAVLMHALAAAHPGVYNVAGDGLLFGGRALRGLGRTPLPLPRWAARLILLPGRLVGRPPALRETLARLYDPLVIDTARLKAHFAYRPRLSARQALAEAGRAARAEPAIVGG